MYHLLDQISLVNLLGTLIQVFVKQFIKQIFKQNSAQITTHARPTDQQCVKSNLPYSQVEFLTQDALSPYLVRCFAEELNIDHKPKSSNKEE